MNQKVWAKAWNHWRKVTKLIGFETRKTAYVQGFYAGHINALKEHIVDIACDLAFKNKGCLTDVNSCYYCLNYSSVEDIKEWADKGETAICPHCGIDSVISGKYDKATLIKVYKKWFS